MAVPPRPRTSTFDAERTTPSEAEEHFGPLVVRERVDTRTLLDTYVVDGDAGADRISLDGYPSR
jgi:hypothetical protein